MTSSNTRGGAAQFPNMLKIASELGCQLKPQPSNPNILAGLCPFHESRNLQEAKTLHVDIQSTRFWCNTCEARGNPTAFIAKVWGMSGAETMEFIRQEHDVTPDRPKPGPAFEAEPGRPNPQNSAILTMAQGFYSKQVESNFAALSYLVKLGIEPEKAIRKGFGYCSGDGLREYLEKRGATPDEIRESTLFQDRTGMEFLSGCPVLADFDYTGACIWMMALVPEDGPQKWEIPTHRPATRGIRGRRNQIFNLRQADRGSNPIIMTDDPRMYLTSAAEDIPTILIPGIKREVVQVQVQAERIAGIIARRNPRRIILAMHDRELSKRIAKTSQKLDASTIFEEREHLEIMKQLRPASRNFQEFIRQESIRRENRERENSEGENNSRNGVEQPPETGLEPDLESELDTELETGLETGPGSYMETRPGPGQARQ